MADVGNGVGEVGLESASEHLIERRYDHTKQGGLPERGSGVGKPIRASDTSYECERKRHKERKKPADDDRRKE